MDHGPGHDRHGRRPHARGHVARTRARGGRRMARRPGPRRRRARGPSAWTGSSRAYGPRTIEDATARTTDGGPSTKGPGHERPPRDHRGHKRMAQTRPMQMGPVPAPRDPGMGGRVLLGPMPAPGAQGGTGTGAGRPLPHVRRTRVQARPGTRARLLLRPVPQQVEPAHPHRDKCPPTAIVPRMRRTARYRHARRILRRRMPQGT